MIAIVLLGFTIAALGCVVVYVTRLRSAAVHMRRDCDEAIERHAQMLRAVVDGVYVVDEALRIGEVNPEAERLLGKTAAALLGRGLEEVVDPLISDLGPDVRYARRTGETVRKLQVAATSGATVEVRVRPAGRDVIVSLRDVTPRKTSLTAAVVCWRNAASAASGSSPRCRMKCSNATPMALHAAGLAPSESTNARTVAASGWRSPGERAARA